MKQYFIPILIAVLLLTSGVLVGCGIGSPKVLTRDDHQQWASFVYNIRPEGVSPEEWYDYLDYDCGFIRYGTDSSRVFSPHSCIEVGEISLPTEVTVGETIIITFKTTPNASLDLEFKYAVLGTTDRRVERMEYVSADSSGVATVSWLVPRDLRSQGGGAYIAINIDAYPNERGYYQKYSYPYDWREMRVATHWIGSFMLWH